MGEIFQGKVRSLSFKGLGVVDHPDGLVFFVPGTWPGDEGQFEITSREKRYGFAKIKELIKSSPHRRKPPCPHFGLEKEKCGGCSWMIADYPSQLEEKHKIVSDLLGRAKLLDNKEKLKRIWGSPAEFGYRNRAQVKTDGAKLGYVSRESKVMAPIEDCLILNETCRKFLSELRAKLPNPEWQSKGRHIWNYIDFDDDSTQIQLNVRRPFKQGNTSQNLRMKQWLSKHLESLNPREEVLELFCGQGNFTEVFAEKGFSKVIAVEGAQESITRLKEKNFANIETIALDLYQPNSWVDLQKIAKKVEVLFLDPPREGFEQLPKLLEVLPRLKEIFYISCDLSTFIHDSKRITDKFEFVEIQPVDQFPQTPHIEILSRLKLRNM